MLIRTLSALVFAPLLLGVAYLGGAFMAVFVGLVAILALRESLSIGQRMGIQPWPLSTTVFSLVWLLILMLRADQWMIPVIVIWLLFALGKMALGYPRLKISEVSYNVLMPLYTVVSFSHLYLIRGLDQGMAWTFLTFILVWATDTFAYLIGRAIGKHPLAPEVSPNKTIEGSTGGLVFCILCGMVAWKIIGGPSWLFFFSLSFFVGVSAQIGDLFESALKRSANVKDSGNLIPGHGGILDRFDSLLFVIPIVYYWLVLSGIAG